MDSCIAGTMYVLNKVQFGFNTLEDLLNFVGFPKACSNYGSNKVLAIIPKFLSAPFDDRNVFIP